MSSILQCYDTTRKNAAKPIYKYDIPGPVGCTTGLNPPREIIARGRSPRSTILSRGIFPVVHPTGLSYLLYYNQIDIKHKMRKNDKHLRFWIVGKIGLLLTEEATLLPL